LGVYRSSKEYSSLKRDINIGDTVKVYYKSGGHEDVNINLIQIERGDRIVLDKKEYEEKQTFLIWIGALASILTFLVGLWHFRKNILPGRKKTNINTSL
jgi:hypothetical protein